MRDRTSPQQQRWNEENERGFATAQDTSPDAFVSWWTGHDHCGQRMRSKDGIMGYSSGITAHKAWQLACYRLEFKERRHEHASGSGLNYAYYGWHRAEDPPRTSNPDILEAHREWCRKHNRPDPAVPSKMPEQMPNVRSFDDAKTIMDLLSDSMDMNKAIGWTQADSDAINDPA